MIISPTPIDGVNLVESALYSDHRGKFYRAYCADELKPIVGERRIMQANLSKSVTVGAIRGMHFQRAPHAEMKLVRCIKGKIWDVTVDLRAGSSTFLQWYAAELSADNCKMMVIPEGCAHGFQVLEEDSELLYLHTAGYSPESEGGVMFNDSLISVAWPLPASDVSKRDMSHPYLQSSFSGLVI